MQHNKDLYLCFKDYEKAFDRVNHKFIRAMVRLGVDWRDRRVIYMLYMNQIGIFDLEFYNTK